MSDECAGSVSGAGVAACGEEHAAARQRIGGRRSGVGVAIAAQVIRPSGVQRDEDDVRLVTPVSSPGPTDPASRGPTTFQARDDERDDGRDRRDEQHPEQRILNFGSHALVTRRVSWSVILREP